MANVKKLLKPAPHDVNIVSWLAALLTIESALANAGVQYLRVDQMQPSNFFAAAFIRCTTGAFIGCAAGLVVSFVVSLAIKPLLVGRHTAQARIGAGTLAALIVTVAFSYWFGMIIGNHNDMNGSAFAFEAFCAFGTMAAAGTAFGAVWLCTQGEDSPSFDLFVPRMEFHTDGMSTGWSLFKAGDPVQTPRLESMLEKYARLEKERRDHASK